jgi:hypothetical protein
MYKVLWGFTQRRFLVRNQRFGTTCLSHIQGRSFLVQLETLKMDQTSNPETLVSYQKTTPDKTQKAS